MARFLHTSDWQLGMTRHFFSEEAQARFTQARFEAIRTIGRLAQEERCELVVVAGDVFDSNQVDRKTVARALEALGALALPVFLLPGNHDALDAASVYRSPTWTQRCPAQVRVIEDAAPIAVRPGLEVVGMPWTSRRPLRDLVAAAGAALEPARETLRIAVAHGAVDALAPKQDDPALVRLADAEALLASGRFHYLALGDRHSFTPVGASGRIAYCGTPEPTDYDELTAGEVAVVDLSEAGASVTRRRAGTWSFVRQRFELTGEADLEALRRWLGEREAKERSAVKLELVGTLSLRLLARLEEALEEARDLFGALESPARHRELAILPEDGDFSGLELGGFARAALEELRAVAQRGGDEATAARDALGLLLRLAGRSR